MLSTNNTRIIAENYVHTTSDFGLDVIETLSPSDLNDQAIPGYVLPGNSQTCSGPDFAQLGIVFPTNLHSAIQQHDDKADVSITFPPPGDCILRLAILPKKVQHVGMKLFGLNVEIDGPLRYVLSEKGRKSIPKTSLLEQGMDTDPIYNFFGLQIQQGIDSSSIRRREVRQGLLTLTACGEFELSNSPTECAYLSITIGTYVGIAVYNQLFG